MKGSEFVEFHKKTVDKMNDICKRKNQDYSGGGDSYAFENFTMVEKMGISSTEQGFLTRMTDKMMRISNIVKSGQTAVKDESVTDTLLDLANYAILMVGYLESKNKEPDNEGLPRGWRVGSAEIKDDECSPKNWPGGKKAEDSCSVSSCYWMVQDGSIYCPEHNESFIKTNGAICQHMGCHKSGEYASPFGWVCNEHLEIIKNNDKKNRYTNAVNFAYSLKK